MHMHGFYFDVDSLGDGMRDQSFGPGQKTQVVTQLMQPGTHDGADVDAGACRQLAVSLPHQGARLA